MIPIRDDAPRTTTPWVNYFLLASNTAIFLLMWLGVPASAQDVANNFGFYPRVLSAFIGGQREVTVHAGVVAVNWATAIIPIFTAMFLHASWGHVLFNMWWLWIFGDNVEDYLGHFRYLIFYLLSGIGAAMLHMAFNWNSGIPSVGASGAIAGVLGAYFLLYPSARVLTLIPFFFIFFTWLPAWLVLGFWFVGQFLTGAATSIARTSSTAGGVAFWAHVGGFVTGLALVKLFPARPRRYRFNDFEGR